jgi:hypothetical protein
MKKNITKICTACNKEKLLSEFHKGIGIFGYKSVCKICRSIERKNFYLIHKKYEDERNRKYRNRNIERERKRSREYNRQHREERNIYNVEHRKCNKLYYQEYHHKYYLKNKEKILKRVKLAKTKYRKNIQNKIAENLRNRIYRLLINKIKPSSSVKDLGCSIEFLKQYLESKFYPNSDTKEKMIWGNYGLYGWHIDHIIPLSSFDLTNKKQFAKACHYTNLQPMWAKENLRKGNRMVNKNE